MCIYVMNKYSNVYGSERVRAQPLTISPFGFTGGNQDTIIFELDAGMALISCGAEGTV